VAVRRHRIRGGWRTWKKKLLAATDRARHRAFEAFADAGQAAISGARLPVMAPDALLCTDGFVSYERIAKDEHISHFALNAADPHFSGPASRRRSRSPRCMAVQAPKERRPSGAGKLLVINVPIAYRI
jgi:hypothetical protein